MATPVQPAFPAKAETSDFGSWIFLGGIPVATTAGAPDAPSGLGWSAPYLAHLADPVVDSSDDPSVAKDALDASLIDPIQTSAIVAGVFGSYAIPMRNFPVSGRWAGVFGSIKKCGGGTACGKGGPAFDRIVGSVAGKPFTKKLAGVNRQINRLIQYKRDQAVYGQRDFWASPLETLSRGAGDCEDFAILKMSALLKAGIPASSMSLVVLQSRSKGAFHAVLSVSTSSGAYILDNVTDTVSRDANISDYLPLYSLSTNRAWIHGSKSGDAQVAAGVTSFGSIVPGEGPEEL
jgi:predicted transglutaminase-like cysteine proteinase